MKPKVVINEFEQAAIEKLLSGNDLVLSELRLQFQKATIKEREMTGAGFYLMFSLPENTARLTNQIAKVKSNFCFGGVNATVENFDGEIGFLIWVEEGKLLMLEGYSYSEKFPEKIEKYELHYFSEPRDIQELRKKWLITSS